MSAQPICGECGAPMVLRVAKRGSLIGTKFYGCSRYPYCDGTHSAHQSTGEPLGVPANKATKRARIDAHAAFDQLHQTRGRMSRKQAYAWLAARLHLTADECHIGRFTIAQCQRVVTLVNQRLTRGFKNERRQGSK